MLLCRLVRVAVLQVVTDSTHKWTDWTGMRGTVEEID